MVGHRAALSRGAASCGRPAGPPFSGFGPAATGRGGSQWRGARQDPDLL